MQVIKELSEKWVREVNNKPTFAGVLEKYYGDVSVNWKEASTRHKNNVDYNNRILPAIKDHNAKSIDQYVKEDFDEVIASIKTDYEDQTGELYQDSTVQHYRHLIYLVINAAAKNCVCNQILWGTTFRIPEYMNTNQVMDERINEYVRLKKSFTPEEEIKIAQELFTDPLQQGEHMGLLLMFAAGLRNAEACAVNYGDIKEFLLHPSNYALWIYSTTKGDTNEVKGSGKSPNADRIIPMFDKLYSFIMDRRAHLQHLFFNSQLQFPPDGRFQSIDDLPIACVGNDYFTRCSVPHLTAAARELFHKIGLNEKQMAYIEVYLSDPFLALKEKEATAYLFRRNFATILHILGFPTAEIHYIIGHEIEDAYETRNEFVDDTRLYQIKKMMEQRPIFGTSSAVETSVSEHLSISNPNCSRIHFQTTASAGVLCLSMQTVEPADTIKVQIRCKGKKSGRIIERHISGEYSRTINILDIFQKQYKK